MTRLRTDLRAAIESLLRERWRGPLPPIDPRDPVLGARTIAIPAYRGGPPLLVYPDIECRWVTYASPDFEGELWVPSGITGRISGPSEAAVMDALISAGTWDWDVDPASDAAPSDAFPGGGARYDYLQRILSNGVDNPLHDGWLVTGRLRQMQQALRGQVGRAFDGLADIAYLRPTADTTYGILKAEEDGGWFWLKIGRGGVGYQRMTFTPQGDSLEAERVALLNASPPQPDRARWIEAYLWTQANGPGGTWLTASGGWPGDGIEGDPLIGGWTLSDDGTAACIVTQEEVWNEGAEAPEHWRGRRYALTIANAGDTVTANCSVPSDGAWKPQANYTSIYLPNKSPAGVLSMLKVVYPLEWEEGGEATYPCPIYGYVTPSGDVMEWVYRQEADPSQGATEAEFSALLAATYHCGVGESSLEWERWTSLTRMGFVGPAVGPFSSDLRFYAGSGGTIRRREIISEITLEDAHTWSSSAHNSLVPVPGKVGGLSGGYSLSLYCEPFEDNRPDYGDYFGAEYLIRADFGTITARIETETYSSRSGHSTIIVPFGDPRAVIGMRSQWDPSGSLSWSDQSGGGLLNMRVWYLAWEAESGWDGNKEVAGACSARIPMSADWTGEFAPNDSLVTHYPDSRRSAGYNLPREIVDEGIDTIASNHSVIERVWLDGGMLLGESASDENIWSGDTGAYQAPLSPLIYELLSFAQMHPSAWERYLVGSVSYADGWSLDSNVLAGGYSAGGIWLGPL